MRIGIHTFTSKGLEHAAMKAHELGANTFQIFSASPRMWRTKRPDPEQVLRLKRAREQHDLHPLVIHDSYLINLAAPASDIREKSIQGFRGEIERAILIGADYLVAHPGNYRGLSIEQGLVNVAEGMALAWRTVSPELKAGATLTVLLENTAGAGAQLGGVFDELNLIRKLASPYLDLPIGFCLDTCHSYVSGGYDLATEAGFQHFLSEARTLLGLENIPVLHANDAGYIGLEGFRRLLNHPELQSKAFILETPVDEPGDDLRNVKALKELLSQNKRLLPRNLNRSGTNAGRRTPRST